MSTTLPQSKVIGYVTDYNGARFFPITEENVHLFEKPSLTDDLDDEAFMAQLMADPIVPEPVSIVFREQVIDFDTAFDVVQVVKVKSQNTREGL